MIRSILATLEGDGKGGFIEDPKYGELCYFV